MDPVKSPAKPILDPIDGISEVLFGLIMVLTFTGSVSIATVGQVEVRSMLIAILGGNLAWGIIDGVFHLIDRLAERGHGLLNLRSVRTARSPLEGQRAIAGALPEAIASVLQPAELETMRERLVRLPEPPAHPRLERDDWLGALVVCLLVVLAAVPVMIPFLFMQNGIDALRVSNGVAILMMFFTGYAHGRRLGHHAWTMGLAMVLLGSALVALTIAFGG